MMKDLIGEWAFILGLIILVVYNSNGYKKSCKDESIDSIYFMIRWAFFKIFKQKINGVAYYIFRKAGSY